jgi:hypothetical protein
MTAPLHARGARLRGALILMLAMGVRQPMGLFTRQGGYDLAWFVVASWIAYRGYLTPEMMVYFLSFQWCV